MPTLTLRNGVTIATDALARRVTFDETMLHCQLQDERVISVPIRWYPRLAAATPEQRNDWELFAGGVGIHWDQIDEDLLVSVLMAGCNEPRDEEPDPFVEAMTRFRLVESHTVETWAAEEPINYVTSHSRPRPVHA